MMFLLVAVVVMGLLAILAVSRRNAGTRMVPVLMYHRVGNVPGDRNTMSPERFRRELDYLSRHGYRTVSPEELLYAGSRGVPLPRRSVMLTFDDATLDTATVVLPELLERGMKGCVFAIADLTESGAEYVGGRAPSPVMGVRDLRRWHEAGMAVGSHTLTHVPLGEVPEELMRKEIAESRAKLERLLGFPVNVLCYPYGSFNAAVKAEAERCGYVMAFAISSGVNPFGFDRYAVPRLGASAGESLAEFALKVSPLFRLQILGRAVEIRVRACRKRLLGR